MFLLDERANTSCNTISDSAINYRAAEAEPVRQNRVELAIDVCALTYVLPMSLGVCVFELKIETECRARENKFKSLASPLAYIICEQNGSTLRSTSFLHIPFPGKHQRN